MEVVAQFGYDLSVTQEVAGSSPVNPAIQIFHVTGMILKAFASKGFVNPNGKGFFFNPWSSMTNLDNPWQKKTTKDTNRTRVGLLKFYDPLIKNQEVVDFTFSAFRTAKRFLKIGLE